MSATAADVHHVLEHRTDRWLLSWIPAALVLALVGLAMIVYESHNSRYPGAALVAIAAVFVVFALYGRSQPGKPALELSAEGLLFRLGLSREIEIPWREIRGVDTLDINVWNWRARIPHRVTFRDCTVVLVSRAFYDEYIHFDSAFMRGPAWEAIFVPRGELVQIALHHEQLCVLPEQVRAPIETRWRAFRERMALQAAAGRSAAVPVLNVTAPRNDSPFHFAWEVTKVAVPVVGIATVLGVGQWETQSPQDVRLEREERAVERGFQRH